jgi:uncharacterized protein
MKDGRVRLRTPLPVVLAVLVVTNVLTTWAARPHGVSIALVTVTLLAVARACGLSWHDLGLGRPTARRGLRWALGCALVVAAGYALLVAGSAVLPIVRDALSDERAPDSLSRALLAAFVLIPVRTVLLEEIAFRGVLWALLRRLRSARSATAWSSALFGLWHLLPAVGFAGGNVAAQHLLGRSTAGTAVVVAGTVVFTAAAGVVLCELRRRSGSLIAPIGLHWAANGLGTLATVAVAS